MPSIEPNLVLNKIFSGLTIRLAQTLGLHWSPDPDTVDVDQRDEATVKYYIWYILELSLLPRGLMLTPVSTTRRSLIWQDTLVSLCYGRPSCITVMDEIPPESSSSALTPPQTYSFTTSCNHLFIVANKICQALNKAGFTRKPLSPSEIQDFKKIIDRIAKQSTPHLRDVEKCQNRDECIQHNFFREFVDSVMLCLYRPALLSNSDAYNKELWAPYLQHCRSVLHTFLELLKLDCPIRRSWVFVHVTLSCALTLGIAANAQNDISDKLFLKGFLDTFSKANIFANVSSYQEALRLLRQSMSTYD